jgi:cell division protein FtsB
LTGYGRLAGGGHEGGFDLLRGFVSFFSPGRLILAFSLLVIGYLLFTAGGGIVDYYRLADDEANLRQQVADLHAQEKELEQIREYLRSDDYVEFMARRVFGLVKPGESLAIVKAPQPESTPVSEDGPSKPWWQELFGR